MARRLVHVAEVDVTPDSGMGRIAWHWREAARRREWEFVHIGPREVGRLPHPAWFPRAARRAYNRLRATDDMLVVHEPASGAFVDCPQLIALSHGIERRYWMLRMSGALGAAERPGLRTRLWFPLWRLRPAERGLRRACGVLVYNQQDAACLVERYRRPGTTVRIIRNGVSPTGLQPSAGPDGPFTIVSIGTWIVRKGRAVVVDTAERLQAAGVAVRWLLAGTGVAADEVRAAFPEALRASVAVIPHFTPDQEDGLLGQAHVFLLPSWFEGLPLSLLQAMAAGRCCVTTATCGQRDVIRDGENGLLFPVGNAAACAAAVLRCAGDASLRLRLGEAARTSVQGWGWARVADEALDAITSLENRGHRVQARPGPD